MFAWVVGVIAMTITGHAVELGQYTAAGFGFGVSIFSFISGTIIEIKEK